MAQRLKTSSAFYMIKETDGYGITPASPVKRLVPLAGEVSFKTDQPRTPAKIFDGFRTPKGSVKGMISASGDHPISLDFRFFGLAEDLLKGHATYRRVGNLHVWIGYDVPGSFQGLTVQTQAPAIYRRNPGVEVTQMRMDVQMSGQAQYAFGGMGNGDELYTDPGGSTVNDGPFVAYNYFDGSLIRNGVMLGNVLTTFNFTHNNNVTRQDAAFSAGKAAGINPGLPSDEGDLGLIYDTVTGDAFYLEAINDTIGSIVCVWANKPLSANPTMFLRKIWPAVLYSRASVAAGGEGGQMQNQHWVAQIPTADWPAEAFSSLFGPWTIPGAANLGIKIDGGATFTVPVAAGSKDAAAIAAIINAYAGFAAVGIASAFNGRLSIKSLSTVAATSKVQIDTAVSGTLHTLLGFTATIFSGYAAAACYTELLNDLSVDYLAG